MLYCTVEKRERRLIPNTNSRSYCWWEQPSSGGCCWGSILLPDLPVFLVEAICQYLHHLPEGFLCRQGNSWAPAWDRFKCQGMNTWPPPSKAVLTMADDHPAHGPDNSSSFVGWAHCPSTMSTFPVPNLPNKQLGLESLSQDLLLVGDMHLGRQIQKW